MRALMAKARAKVVAEAAIFTEGERSRWDGIISLGHLPTFQDAVDSKRPSAST
jgi:adenine phosphoribosyltransferase